MSCGVGRRCSSDPTLLWLWRRLAAIALIRPLAWEPQYAAGVALKSKEKNDGFLFVCLFVFGHPGAYGVPGPGIRSKL